MFSRENIGIRDEWGGSGGEVAGKKSGKLKAESRNLNKRTRD